MISKEILRELTIKWQTNATNVSREYLEHLFLSSFYQQRKARSVVFKGGTALRLVHGSPRFSEDLDFDGYVMDCWEIESLWENILVYFEKEGLQVDIRESTKTTGGCLGIFTAEIYGLKIDIKIEVSLRSRWKEKKKKLNVNINPFISDYSVFVVQDVELVKGKLNAFLTRSKPRDLFDIYYILRKRLAIEEVVRRKEELIKLVEEYDYSILQNVLNPLLPESFRPLIKDFKNSLKEELERL